MRFDKFRIALDLEVVQPHLCCGAADPYEAIAYPVQFNGVENAIYIVTNATLHSGV